MGKRRKNNKTLIYVIDENFRIVYSNEEQNEVTRLKYGKLCYEVICNEYSQCRKCPLREENRGESIIFNDLHKEWVNVNSAPIEWPGVGKCYMLMSNCIEGNSKSFFYNVAGNSDYNELLELNYAEDTYNIIDHSTTQISHEEQQQGKISEMVRSMAERLIHPDDRKRFYDFWLLDQIGTGDVPDETLKMRHGEFRKRKPDGSYKWVQQVFMPARKSKKNPVYIMSFYNILGDQNKWEDHFLNTEEKLSSQGLYSRQYFFKRAEEVLRNSEDSIPWCMIAIDIESFKLFNEWYGCDVGDELLDGIAECLKDMQKHGQRIAGYFGNDDFALLMEYDEEQIEELFGNIIELLKSYNYKTGFLPAFGIYRITDKNGQAFMMYDRAEIAQMSIRGNYTTRIKLFDTELLEKLESEYVLFSDIQKALANEEFTFFLQPKCNMKNGKIMGAEALTRWISEEKGIIPPGVFIPFLENSGFIAELDAYIWEQVCKWQREILDRGIQALPVSVNVSRADMYSMDVPEYFAGLIEKYNLDSKLIELEVTESTYAEDHEFINEIIDKLRKSGFRVLMDDFGSGYSSLNMLKNIEVDVLKIDMRFLDISKENESKGIGILETVYKMAGIMGLGVVVEGVETEEQKTFLLKMGCNYGQGYYFYKPLPIQDFENLIKDSENLDKEEVQDTKVEKLQLQDLLSENLFSEIMLNNILGAVAVYDVYQEQITVTQCNEQYASLVGDIVFEKEIPRNPLQLIDAEQHQTIFQLLDIARNSRQSVAEGDFHSRRVDGTDIWMHLRVFFLREQDGHALYYGAISDATEIYEKNKVLTEQNQTLRFLNNDMPGGYYRHQSENGYEFTYISQRFLDIFGYTREEIQSKFDNKFMNMIHPDDRYLLERGFENMKKNGGLYSQSYRMCGKNGYIMVLDQSKQVTYEDKTFFQGLILSDLVGEQLITEKENTARYNEVMSFAPCGVFQSEADDNHEFAYVSDSMLSILGYSREAFQEKFKNNVENLVYEEDSEHIGEETRKQLEKSNYVFSDYRIEMADGTLKWVCSFGRLVTDHKGKRWFYVCIADYDYVKKGLS